MHKFPGTAKRIAELIIDRYGSDPGDSSKPIHGAQSAFSRAVGISVQKLNRLLQEKESHLYEDEIRRIAEAFDVSEDWVREGKGQKYRERSVADQDVKTSGIHECENEIQALREERAEIRGRLLEAEKILFRMQDRIEAVLTKCEERYVEREGLSSRSGEQSKAASRRP